jgi:hypothetical protein
MLIEVIDIAVETESKPLGQCALDVTAGFGAWKQDPERAARFYGAAQAQVFATGVQRDPTDAAFLVPLIERARDALGNDAFEKEERAGRAWSYEQAIDEARQWLTRASS